MFFLWYMLNGNKYNDRGKIYTELQVNLYNYFSKEVGILKEDENFP